MDRTPKQRALRAMALFLALFNEPDRGVTLFRFSVPGAPEFAERG
jgi:hypothetical protein